MALDFTALNRIAYRGFETVEEQQQKDSLIDQGYTIIENEELPFPQATETASEPLSSSALTNTSSTPQKASERKIKPFMSVSGDRDYKAMYRAAHDFHQRNAPPVVDRDYWRTHTVGIDDTPEAEIAYWMRAAEDVSSTANAYRNDPFLTGLLVAVYEELEREYKLLRENAQKQASEAV